MSAPILEELFAADHATALGYIRFLSGRICFLNQKLDAFTSSSGPRGASWSGFWKTARATRW